MRKANKDHEPSTDTSSDVFTHANLGARNALQEHSHSLVQTVFGNRRDKLMPNSRRDHYRVMYPFAERPTLEIGRAAFEIIECSERGLRYDVGERRSPTLGTPVAGRIAFRSGEMLDVVGEVVRLQDGLVAVVLQPPGISFATVMHEQRYLRGKGYQVTD
jgi:hypothetical protein